MIIIFSPIGLLAMLGLLGVFALICLILSLVHGANTWLDKHLKASALLGIKENPQPELLRLNTDDLELWWQWARRRLLYRTVLFGIIAGFTFMIIALRVPTIGQHIDNENVLPLFSAIFIWGPVIALMTLTSGQSGRKRLATAIARRLRKSRIRAAMKAAK